MLENIAPQYYVWGTDRISYGPVELPTLVHWIREERVLRETWVFAEITSAWTQAGDLTEAKAVFKIKPAGGAPAAASIINPVALRRVKIFADLDDKVRSHLCATWPRWRCPRLRCWSGPGSRPIPCIS